MRLRKSIAGIALVAVLTAGCGGSSGQKVTIDATPAAMRKSAEATLDKGPFKLQFTMDMSFAGQALSLPGTGVMDPPNKRFQIDFDAKDLFTKILSAHGTPPPDVLAAFDQPFTEILDGTVLYMRIPAPTKTGGTGRKQWLKVDLASANNTLAEALGSGGTGAFGADPSSFVQFLEGAGKVTKVGEEDVRGVKTTHFSGSYTLKDSLASLPSDRRDKVEKAFEGLGLPSSAEDQEMPFDAWLSDDGLVRRVQTTIDPSTFAPNASASAAAPIGKVSVSMELYDFGTSVDIQTPSDDEVQDVSSLASSAGSTFSSVASSIGN